MRLAARGRVTPPTQQLVESTVACQPRPVSLSRCPSYCPSACPSACPSPSRRRYAVEPPPVPQLADTTQPGQAALLQPATTTPTTMTCKKASLPRVRLVWRTGNSRAGARSSDVLHSAGTARRPVTACTSFWRNLATAAAQRASSRQWAAACIAAAFASAGSVQRRKRMPTPSRNARRLTARPPVARRPPPALFFFSRKRQFQLAVFLSNPPSSRTPLEEE
jgi:hypothetical protein